MDRDSRRRVATITTCAVIDANVTIDLKPHPVVRIYYISIHSSYDSDVISRYLSKSAFFKGVGHFKCKFHLEGDIAHQPLLVSEN